MRLGGAGNETIESVDPSIRFRGGKLLHAAPVGDLGDYAKHFALNWKFGSDNCIVSMAFLNPGQTVELEFLVSEYEKTDIDLAAPSVAVRFESASRWDAALRPLTANFSSIGLEVLGLGIRYNASTTTLNDVVRELAAIRNELSQMKTRKDLGSKSDIQDTLKQLS